MHNYLVFIIYLLESSRQCKNRAPKSKAFFLLNINLFVSAINKFGGHTKVLQTQFVKIYVNVTNGISTTLYTPANNFHFQAKFFQSFISI